MASTINNRFILAEETALKAKFEGLQVTSPKVIDVDVWFRWPNKEIREVRYPFIAIDLADVSKSDRREHSGGPFELFYEPHNYEATYDPEVGARVADEWPVPYDLIYTVTVVTLDPRHDRELKFKLLGDRNRIPHRWAHLQVEDGTVRRLDVLDVEHTSIRDANRTQFFTVFTLNVESELFAVTVEDLLRVTSVSLTLREIITGVTEEISTPTP